jgi:membrane-associated protease RseP (regulator of RpoE activity)
MLDRLGEKHDLPLSKRPGGIGPSDHASFYRVKIPAMHFITGIHTDLHRTTDVFEKLDVPGMRRIGAMVEDLAVELAGLEQRPQHIETGRSSLSPGRPPPLVLGCQPDLAGEGPGVLLSSVTKDGPAEKAGIKAGDRIIRIGDTKIDRVTQILALLRQRSPGDRVKVVVRRSEEEITVEATLAPPG